MIQDQSIQRPQSRWFWYSVVEI